VTPTHPGAYLATAFLDPWHLTVTDVAKAIGVSRKTVSEIIHGHQAITPDMSVRLAMAFGTPDDFWIKRQVEYDLAVSHRRRRLRIKRLTPVTEVAS